MSIKRLEKAIEKAWIETEEEFVNKKCPRALFWTESAALVHPFYCNLKKVMEERGLSNMYQIVTGYNPKTPSPAKKKCKCKKQSYGEKNRSIDLCIIEFDKKELNIDYSNSKDEHKNCSMWCFKHKIIAAMEFKYGWDFNDHTKKDIDKLEKIGKECKLLYVCFISKTGVNKKYLFGFVKKFKKRFRFAIGYFNENKWDVLK